MMSKAGQAGTMRKKCTRCKKTKIASSFAMNRSSPDGLFTWCKKCQLETRKDRLEKVEAFAREHDIDSRDLMTFKQAKQAFDMSEPDLRQAIKNGSIPAINVGAGKLDHWRIVPPAPETPETDVQPLDVGESSPEPFIGLKTAPSGLLVDAGERPRPTARTFRALYQLQGYALAMEEGDNIVKLVEELTSAIEEWA